MKQRTLLKFAVLSALASVMLAMGCTNPAQGDGAGITEPTSPAAPVSEAPASSESTPTESASSGSAPQLNRNNPIESTNESNDSMAKLLCQGHASFRITTAEGKVIYVDPYAGEGYDVPADLILVTHEHSDHNKLSLIQCRNSDCEVITEKEALKGGARQVFDLGYVTVEATEAGNKNHDPTQCVGYILALSGGILVYATSDTSKTAQMETLAQRHLDYALICCDGVYNMDVKETSECAELIAAKHSIPYHMAPGKLFSQEIADQFQAGNRLIVKPGEEIILKKQ